MGKRKRSSRSSVSHAPNKRQEPSLSSSINSLEETLLESFCSTHFNLGNGPFKRFTNKLKRICNKILNRKGCDIKHLSSVREQAKNDYQQNKFDVELTIEHRNEELEIFLAYIKSAPKLLRSPLEKWKVQYKNEQGVDHGGVRRSYMQAAANQLLDWALKNKVLVETESGSGIYTLNLQLSQQDPEQEREVNCKLLGQCLAFFICSGITINFQLSRVLLASLLILETEKISDDDCATIFLMEYPEQSRPFITCLQHPEYIKTFSEETITIENFPEYLGEYAKEKILPSSQLFSKLLGSFQEGFFIHPEVFRPEVMVPQLSTMLISIEVPLEHIKQIADKVIRNFKLQQQQEQQEQQEQQQQQKHRAVTLFYEILTNGEKSFPSKAVTERSVPLPADMQPPKTYKEFIPKLLFWWTGKRAYDPNMNYKIELHSGNNFASHTCAEQIDVPLKYTKLDEMYTDLVLALSNFDFGLP